ncbi:hypothetical protein [Limimaricola cinnabarinus]|uniref:hypothetical protein n=1 Tax=Limimaricola cinnabarinus TaxID=1125964 RepID=UPI00103F788B
MNKSMADIFLFGDIDAHGFRTRFMDHRANDCAPLPIKGVSTVYRVHSTLETDPADRRPVAGDTVIMRTSGTAWQPGPDPREIVHEVATAQASALEAGDTCIRKQQVGKMILHGGRETGVP